MVDSKNIHNITLLNQVILLTQNILTDFAVSDFFFDTFEVSFGNNFSLLQAEVLRQQWISGDFNSFPSLELISAEQIAGALGAFSKTTDTIYISEEYFKNNIDNPHNITKVLLEEVGHFIDSKINLTDSFGDEGAIFSALVLNETLSQEQILELKAEDDRVSIILDGQLIEIEQAQSVSDSGGFEGSQKTITLDSTEGGVAKFRYEHFFIPDNFQIRYEGKNLLTTGFVGGSRSGEVQIPKGNSDKLEIIVATNDEGTAWNYDVTVDDCPDTGVLNIELANGEFMDSDQDGDCEGSGTVFLGHKSGISRILRIDGATVEFDDKELRVLDGTVVSLIGNVSEPLFSGNFVVDLKTGSTKSLTDTREANQFKFGDLVDIDFKSLNINPNNVAFTGDFTLPVDLGEVEVKLDGTPNSLIIDNNGARFGGGKVSFPRQEFRFLEQSVPPGLFKVDANNLSIEYIAADDQLKFQGKLTLKDPITKNENGDFALGNTEVIFDFAGNNFIGIKDGKVDVVGSASVKNITLPGGWGLNELGISIDTTKGEIKGKTRVSFPFPARSPIPPAFGGQQQAGPDAGLEVGFLLPPPNTRLDSVMADVDKLNIAIGTTGFFFQRVAGSVSNISKPDPIRFGGGIGFSYGPIVTLPIPGLAQDLLGLPSSVDAAVVNVQLNVDSDFQSSIAGSGEVSIVSPSLFKIGGMTEYNWDKDFATGKGSLDVISGLVSGTASGRLDIDRGNFDGSGKVSITIPDVSLFGFLKGKTLGSANAQFQYRDDASTANDFVNAWGEIDLGSVNLPIIGEINLGLVDVGIRYRYLEGNVSLLGDNLPLIGSWDVQADSEWVLIGADWENANSDVRIRVIDPNGNVYQESEFADNGIAVVEQLSDDKTRTVVIGRPQAGIWDIEIVDETGLGEINYSAIGATDAPEITLLTPDQDISSDLVNISFEAFDSDSDATISLFYDTDNLDFDGAFITDLTETDGLNSFQWNTEGIATGEYFIYAMAMDDESAPVFSNYSLGKVIVSEETDLSIIQTANTDVVAAGGLLTYTVEVKNNGTVDSSNVIVTETLGDGANFISSTVTPSSQTDNELSFDLGNISSGETKTFEITVTTPTEGETLFSSAYVEGSVFDFDATNDVSIVATTIEPIIPDLPDLEVLRSDNSEDVSLGENYTYSLTVTNNGLGAATGVVLTEFLPSTVNVVSSPFSGFGNTRTANLGTLDAGESTTLDVTVNSFAAGDLTTTTEVTSNEEDINPIDNSLITSTMVESTTPAAADLELTQTVNNLNPEVGEEIQITLTLANQGPGIASGIQVANLLPPELSFVSSSAVQGSYNSQTGIWDVGNIRDNLSRSLTITAKVEVSQTITNTAEVIAVNETDPDSTPNNNNPNEDDIAIIQIEVVPTANEILGTSGNDLLRGTIEEDIIKGFDGDDRIVARTGNDTLFGGNGNDELYGQNGDDQLYGQNGNDLLIGGEGEDKLYGHAGNDTLNGAKGDDKLYGSLGDDVLYGLIGNDTLLGQDGNDRILGGSDNDKVFGGNGDDTLNGGDGNDLLKGNQDNDRIFGGNGSDRIFGGQGNDTLTGEADRDIFVFTPTTDLQNGDVDVITDFEISKDFIDLRRFNLDLSPNSQFDDFSNGMTQGLENAFYQKGANVYIEARPQLGYGLGSLGTNGTIVLKNVNIDDLSAANFRF